MHLIYKMLDNFPISFLKLNPEKKPDISSHIASLTINKNLIVNFLGNG